MEKHNKFNDEHKMTTRTINLLRNVAICNENYIKFISQLLKFLFDSLFPLTIILNFSETFTTFYPAKAIIESDEKYRVSQ